MKIKKLKKVVKKLIDKDLLSESGEFSVKKLKRKGFSSQLTHGVGANSIYVHRGLGIVVKKSYISGSPTKRQLKKYCVPTVFLSKTLVQPMCKDLTDKDKEKKFVKKLYKSTKRLDVHSLNIMEYKGEAKLIDW